MSNPTRGNAPDWSLGRYEDTAAQLGEAASAVVERARLRPGERVVDIGCGTGSAALLAAAAGAEVVGVDPAVRLLEVAREQAQRRGLPATFVTGDAAALPLPSAGTDVAVSSFGVIFAPDAVAAAAEISRVLAPHARLVLSVWLPVGVIAATVRVFQEAVVDALGLPPPGSPPFAWHDPDALAGLLAGHGFDVDVEQHTLVFTAASPEARLEAEIAHHPLAVAGAAVLAAHGRLDSVRDAALEVLRAGNEDPSAFRVTSRYVIAAASR